MASGKSVKLDSKTARAKLAPRREPYWVALSPGRHVGYRRTKGAFGAWVAKHRDLATGERTIRVIGPADDVAGQGCSFAAAVEQASAWFRQCAEGGGAIAASTVGDVVRAYLAWLDAHRKTSTAESARYSAEANILPQLGAIRTDRLTTRHIERWRDQLAKTPARRRTSPRAEAQRYGALDDIEAQRCARVKANRMLTILKAALNRALEDRVFASDEIWRRVKPFAAVERARPRWLSVDEAKRLLNAAPPDFADLIRGALLTGARYGELCRAKVGDLSLEAGALHVPESKSGKPRHIPLDDEALAFLGALAAGRDASEHLFRRADGKPWGKSHQLRPIKEASAAARLDPPANFHCLRHSWASHRVMNGAPLMVVAHVLGHADTRMVEKHYGHLAPSYVREVVRKTGMGLGGEGSNVLAFASRETAGASVIEGLGREAPAR